MALTRNLIATTIAATLPIVNANQVKIADMDVTYKVRQREANEAALKEYEAAEETKTDAMYPVRQLLLDIVTAMDAPEYPLTHEGLTAMDSDFPGILTAILWGYHRAREVGLAKN